MLFEVDDLGVGRLFRRQLLLALVDLVSEDLGESVTLASPCADAA
jgi:hypothetical protein